MILADKIINERKRNGWSQEELAEKLSVSRQSVSKWEGAQSVPDIQKIIQMAQIFGVSTDYLLKDEIDSEDGTALVEVDTDRNVRKVSMEEANRYIELEKKYSPWIANAVSMCIGCPIVLVFMAAYSEINLKISEGLAAGVGLIVLFIMIVCAVAIFMKTDNSLKEFDYLQEEEIETEYGVSGMVKERKKAFESKKNFLNIIGVVLCIVCSLPLLISSLAGASDFVVVCMVCVLLIIISIAVNIFVRTNSISDCYEKLLQEEEFSVKAKKENKRIRPLVSIYWSIATVIYLAWSFITSSWDFTWIVWPIAGVLFFVYKQIVVMLVKEN